MWPSCGPITLSMRPSYSLTVRGRKDSPRTRRLGIASAANACRVTREVREASHVRRYPPVGLDQSPLLGEPALGVDTGLERLGADVAGEVGAEVTRLVALGREPPDGPETASTCRHPVRLSCNVRATYLTCPSMSTTKTIVQQWYSSILRSATHGRKSRCRQFRILPGAPRRTHHRSSAWEPGELDAESSALTPLPVHTESGALTPGHAPAWSRVSDADAGLGCGRHADRMGAPPSVSAASFWKPLDEGFDLAREGQDVDRRGWEVRLLDSRADLGSKLVAASAPFDPPGVRRRHATQSGAGQYEALASVDSARRQVTLYWVAERLRCPITDSTS